jgi:mono/diheme cytochrome c family protein
VRRLPPLLLALLLPVLVIACGGGTTEDTAPEDVQGGAQTQTEAAGETGATGATETVGGDDGDAAEGDPEAGSEVFASAGCGNCHVLEAAGSTGTVGPNLDEADPDFEEAVAQIKSGGGGMPAYEGQLSEEEIANVAAFVTEARR